MSDVKYECITTKTHLCEPAEVEYHYCFIMFVFSERNNRRCLGRVGLRNCFHNANICIRRSPGKHIQVIRSFLFEVHRVDIAHFVF